MPRTLLFAVYLITTLSSSSVFARQESAGEQPVTRWTHALVDDIAMTWNEPQYHDLYVPFLSWHARFMYDKEKTDKYNEMPWGGGLGLSRYNDEGNWSALFAMMFKDSHNEWQPAMGYGWEKGLNIMRERAMRLGGTLHFSCPPEGGTQVEVCFPSASSVEGK
jgi:palmitoyl transferase